jgi:hypothetical protein
VTWFADAPLGGGPSDTALAVHLVVLPKDAPMDGGAPPQGDGGTPRGYPDAGTHEGGAATPPGDGLAASTDTTSGCSSAARRAPSRGAPIVIVLGALALARRRLRRRATRSRHCTPA